MGSRLVLGLVHQIGWLAEHTDCSQPELDQHSVLQTHRAPVAEAGSPAVAQRVVADQKAVAAHMPGTAVESLVECLLVLGEQLAELVPSWWRA